jgi:hypothetical protein
MYINVHVKYPLFLEILMKLELSLKVFGKPTNAKFHENPMSGVGVFPCGETKARTA